MSSIPPSVKWKYLLAVESKIDHKSMLFFQVPEPKNDSLGTNFILPNDHDKPHSVLDPVWTLQCPKMIQSKVLEWEDNWSFSSQLSYWDKQSWMQWSWDVRQWYLSV